MESDIDTAGDLLGALVQNWDYLASEWESNPERVAVMLALTPTRVALDKAAEAAFESAQEARVEGRLVSAEELRRLAGVFTDAASLRGHFDA